MIRSPGGSVWQKPPGNEHDINIQNYCDQINPPQWSKVDPSNKVLLVAQSGKNHQEEYDYICPMAQGGKNLGGRVHFRAQLPQGLTGNKLKRCRNIWELEVDNCSMKWRQAKAVEAPLLLLVLTPMSLKVFKLAGDQSPSVSTAKGMKIPPAPPPRGEHPSPPHPVMQQTPAFIAD